MFDEASHTYTLDTSVLPSVTQIITAVYGRSYYADPWYMQRGTAVHAAAAYIARDKGFEFDPALANQVAQIRAWFAAIKPVVLSCEIPLASARYRYAGTADLICRIGSKRIIVDWKSSASPTDPLQLAGYGILADADWGMVVELPEKGAFKCSDMVNLKLWKARFLATLTVHNTMQLLGIPGRKEEGK